LFSGLWKVPVMNFHQMCRGKDLKGNKGKGFGIGGLLPRRWSAPPLHFWRSSKILKKHWHVKIPRSGSVQCKKNMIPSWQTTHGLCYHFPPVGNPCLTNGCLKSNKAQMGRWNATRPD
jgi:hypothetical protein